jgi:Integrase core domain/Transposase
VAAVLDLYSRRVVGWPMQPTMTSQLVMDVLPMAIFQHGRPRAVLHYSDQASQYTSEDFQRLLDAHGIVCSMSRRSNCWDTQSTMVESACPIWPVLELASCLRVDLSIWSGYSPSVAGASACDLIGALYCTVRVLLGNGIGDALTFNEERDMDDQARQNEVILGVDTYLDTHAAAVISHAGRFLGTHATPTTSTGYLQLLTWARSLGCVRRAGVEGTGTYGAGLTRVLREQGVEVPEVNHPDRCKRRLKGKSDPTDEESAHARFFSAWPLPFQRCSPAWQKPCAPFPFPLPGAAVKARRKRSTSCGRSWSAPRKTSANVYGKPKRSNALQGARICAIWVPRRCCRH